MYQKRAKKGKNPGRPASPRPAGLAPPKTQSRLRTGGNVTHSRVSESRVGPWFNWKHRKASTSIQRSIKQPKSTSISRTNFPGECPRIEQSLGQVRGRDGLEGGWPASSRPAGLATTKPARTQLSTDFREGLEPLSERWRPCGSNPRPAGLGEAGRPHLEASQAEVWHGS